MAGIYIHVPFCRHKCSYCDFTSFPDKIEYAEAYMACLYKELKMRGEELKNYEFDTVYFGGGTPSYIPPKLILGAMNQIRSCFKLTKDAEITLELNPGTIGESKVETYLKAGVNRFSIGLQTAIDEQLADLNRIHNVRDYVYATKLLKGLKALEALVEKAGGEICGRMAILAEGDAIDREDIIYLEPLPLFNADGTVLA